MSRFHCRLWVLLGGMVMTAAMAQGRIYRCGNEYTNNPTPAQTKSCKLVDGGNVTVVQTGRPAVAAQAKSPRGAGSAAKASEASPEQKVRDSDARQILEDELRKAEQKRAELLKEYNSGEPEKLGPEHRNHQKYLDRVAELKSSIDRSETDIAGLKRELARLAGR